jgi:hypothetical protein
MAGKIIKPEVQVAAQREHITYPYDRQSTCGNYSTEPYARQAVFFTAPLPSLVPIHAALVS